MTSGTPLSPFVIQSVAPAAMQEWAVFLADPNPIHLDPQAVKALGLGDRLINQGPANIAYVANLLAANFPHMRVETLDCRFTGNVFAGDRCTAGGHVLDSGDGWISCEVWLDVEGGTKAVTGTARLVSAPVQGPPCP